MEITTVYDSFFGNSKKIAQTIGKALGTQKNVTTVKVDQLEKNILNGIQKLVVGSPTRGFNPTPAIRSFLKNIPANGLTDIEVAAFDTRIPMGDKVPGFLRFMVKLFGYADKPMMDLMVKKGGKEILPTEGFFVADSEGPLVEGEITRAEEWGKKIKAS